MRRCVLLLLPLLLPLGASASRLRSPWDSHSITLTNAAYICPPIVHLSKDLTTSGFYSDSRGSIIDSAKWKAYAASSGPYKKLGEEIVDAADAYRTTGSRQAVRCAVSQMLTAAKDGVFTGKMSSNQAYYVQGWVIGAIAIAYLKIRGSLRIGADERRVIQPWIMDAARKSMKHFDERQKMNTGDSANNHLYWAGVEVAAAGIATNNRRLFRWGLATYTVGIDQIQPDGSLPREMRRGRRALHYHLYAVAPLVYLAEFGEDNGFDLYAARNNALKRLVKLSTDGLVDNRFFDKAAGVEQDLPDGPPAAEQISWARIWVRRFPDPTIAALLKKARSLSYMYLGGLPPE